MNNEEAFREQSAWTVFLNEPITKKDVNDLLHKLKVRKIIFKGENDDFHKADANWHTIVFDDLAEVNKLRTVLLMENYKVELRTTDTNKGYIDVWSPGK